MILNKIKGTSIKELSFYIFNKLPSLLVGKIKRNIIYTHWGRGLNNFGDCLSPPILKYYGFTPVFSQKLKADIILAGTVLQWLPEHYSGIILGTGGDDMKYSFPNAKIIGVRGKKTLENIEGEKENVILGDPGLIMNLIYPEKTTPKYDLGIVPHFVDKDKQIIDNWNNKFSKDKDCLVIDVLRSPKKVIADIKKCRHIMSSSLHGLVVADAFNIPNVRFVLRETMPSSFYDYKFDDYSSSLDTKTSTIEATGNESYEHIISKMQLHTEKVKLLQQELDSAFKQVKNYLKE